MNLSAILAHDDKYGIGKNNDLPWQRNAADMKWFRECTIGHVVVMGRKTWESIGSKPLSKRVNVVVSTQTLDGPDQVISGDIATSIRTLTEQYSGLKVWIIGGAKLYKQMLPMCDNIYLTHIPGDYNCDTFVPMNEYLTDHVKLANKKQDGLTFSIWRRM